MIDKFKVFNKIKLDTDKYKKIETSNNEDLKIKMKARLNSSERIKKNRKKTNILISTVASITIIIGGAGVFNPSLADNIIQNISEFQTMLDKIKKSINDEGNIEYNPGLYPEREEEKKENEKNKLIATPINVSSKSNGLKITIDKAMYDRKKIYIDMTLKTDKPFKESKYMKAVHDSPYGDGEKNMYLDDLKLYINGIELDSYSYGPGVIEFIDEYRANFTCLIELDPSNNIDNANFKIDFGIPKYKHPNFKGKIKGRWSFDFNIKSIDDIKKHIEVNKKDGDYTLKSVDVSNTYVEVKMELPFQPSLGNPHNNFVIVKDNNGSELPMSVGTDEANRMYTQINELNNIGEIPKYIDILVLKDLTDKDQNSKALSSFRVNLE
jgi:hypothetical protein